MCARWEGEKEREATASLIREQTKDTIIIFIDGGGSGARELRAGRNVDVRYIYFGRNTTVMMSSSIFENLLVRLGPRAILVSKRSLASRPKASLVSSLVVSCRRDVDSCFLAATRKTTWNSSNIRQDIYFNQLHRNIPRVLSTFFNYVAWILFGELARNISRKCDIHSYKIQNIYFERFCFIFETFFQPIYKGRRKTLYRLMF